VIIPWQVKAGAALAVVVGVGAAYGWTWQRGFDTATRERAARDAVAVIVKLQDNVAVTASTAETNTIIERVRNEELKPIVHRIATERVRVGKAICPDATTTKSESTGSSDSGDSAGRLVRADVERDIKALTLRVEEGFATGRACQARLKAEGLMD